MAKPKLHKQASSEVDFLDFDALEQDSKDANIVPHPLREKLSASEKASYINLIVFAGLADDGNLSDVELEYGRTRAISLGLAATEFDDAVKVVRSLDGPQERMQFLHEMLTAFTDRAAAMFVLCDTAQAMASDGDLTENARKYLDSLCRFLLKSEKSPDNPLTSVDQKFLADYRPFLAPGKTSDASEVVQAAAQNDFDFPAGLVTYFTPELKPVALDGGVRTERKYSLCAGKFTLETELTIGKDTELVLRDAEIIFGPKASLVLAGAKIVIENCTFRAAESKATDVRPDRLVMIYCSDVNECEFKNCTFNGGRIRTAIGGDTKFVFTMCKFSEFKVPEWADGAAVVRSGKDVVCRECDFSQCHCVGGNNAIVSVERFTIRRCTFTDCQSDDDLFLIKWDSPFKFDKCKFVRCFAANRVVGVHSVGSGSHDYSSSDGFFECCAVDLKYAGLCGDGWPSYKSYSDIAKQVSLTEDEFQKALETTDNE